MKEIQITKGRTVLVDEEDYEKLAKYNWQLLRDYAGRTDRSSDPRKTVYMHKVIIDCPDNFIVDHINGNTLDNRKSNLRIATREQNRYNQKLRHNSNTGYKGVTFNKPMGKYQARIFKENKNYSLGYFDNPNDAARMYNFWAVDLFGEYARLNVINEEETK